MSRTLGLYGFAIHTDLELRCGAPEVSKPADLCLELVATPPLEWNAEAFPPVYTSSIEDETGRSVLTIHRPSGAGGAWDVLCFPRVADFYLGADRILCLPAEEGSGPVLEVRLVGTVLAFWAERAGRPALHASAVASGSRAAVFLAGQQSGKSSLAAALMTQGLPLLSDDILVLERSGQGFQAFPGHAQMRMWPDLADYFLTPVGCDWQALAPVLPGVAKRCVTVGRDFGTLCTEPRSPGVLYLPHRLEEPEAEIAITPVAPRDALRELLRHSFLHRMPAALGWEARRLDFLVRLVETVPVRRLDYPAGFDRLPEVAAAVMEDLAREAPSASTFGSA